MAAMFCKDCGEIVGFTMNPELEYGWKPCPGKGKHTPREVTTRKVCFRLVERQIVFHPETGTTLTIYRYIGAPQRKVNAWIAGRYIKAKQRAEDGGMAACLLGFLRANA